MTDTTDTAGLIGIHQGITNEAYHAGAGVSKSGLWKIATSTPAHFKFGVRKENPAFDFGEACHLAILQPDEFETTVYRGPEDRRGNKWKDAQEFCGIDGKLLLTSSDFDAALAVRDAVHADAWVHSIITGGQRMVEASGFWTDEETGVLCRCRPDLYRADLGIILDLKTTTSAAPDKFARSVVDYGYHAQEAFYSDGWRALGQAVNGFVFLAVEKEAPYAFSVYELPPSIVEEGRAHMRTALQTYGHCQNTGHWPGFDTGVQELAFPRWAYKLIEAPAALDMEAA